MNENQIKIIKDGSYKLVKLAKVSYAFSIYCNISSTIKVKSTCYYQVVVIDNRS
nr:hypothetical protein [Candidatus Sigynarchaeota archaeon]